MVYNWNKMVTITVPVGLNGWQTRGRVIINGREYTFPIGVETQVPEPVAAHINKLLKMEQEDKPELPESGCVDTVAREQITALTDEFDAFKESGGGGGMPEGGAPNQMLVTNADGETEWQERPVYKTTEAMSVNDLIGTPIYPTTFTTVANSGMNTAQGEFFYDFSPGAVCKVVFDGVTYSCVTAEDGNLGAKVDSSNDTIDFSEYPFVFVIPGNMILTETPGEHTIEAVYVHTVERKVNYGTNIFAITQEDENRMPYLSLEQVERIKSAWGNGATVSISTNVPGGGLGVSATVTKVTDSFIYATATYGGNKGCVETVTYLFAVSDGTLYKSGCSVIGSVTENAAMYPVMYIKGRYYKINVDDSGTLTATEVTE